MNKLFISNPGGGGGASGTAAITGGTVTGLTSLGLRNAGTGAYDLTLACNTTLTAARTLTLVAPNAACSITIPASGTLALLGTANAFTAAQTISVNGAASTPALALTGTIFSGGTGTTTFPLVLVQPSGATASTNWSIYGTAIGVNLDVGGSYPNHPLFFEGQVDGVAKLGLAASGRFFGAGFMIGSSRVSAETNVTGFTEQAGGAGISLICNTQYVAAFFSTGIQLDSSLQYFWTNGTSYAGTRDTGLSRSAASIVRVTNGSTGGGSLEFLEQTAPSAGGGTSCRLYAEDSGGKTRLMAIFGTGAAQQIAIEP
jgi:hypothetical protein